MQQRVITMGLCAMLAFGMSVSAQKKEQKPAKAQMAKMEEKPLKETMKALPAPFQGLKKNIDAKDAAAAEKDAQLVADLFKATDHVWVTAKFADAEKMSKENQTAAKQIVSAVKAGKFEDAGAPYSVIVKSCVGCHNVHREKLPDGSYKMK